MFFLLQFMSYDYVMLCNNQIILVFTQFNQSLIKRVLIYAILYMFSSRHSIISDTERSILFAGIKLKYEGGMKKLNLRRFVVLKTRRPWG